MPVSKNRKNHKQKSAARSLGIRNFRKSVQKLYQNAMASKIELPTGDPLGAQEGLNRAIMPMPGEYDVDLSPQNAAKNAQEGVGTPQSPVNLSVEANPSVGI